MREILFFKGILIFLTSPQYFRLTATILSGPNSGVPENEKLSFTEVTEKVFLSGEMGNMYREVTVKKTAKEQEVEDSRGRREWRQLRPAESETLKSPENGNAARL